MALHSSQLSPLYLELSFNFSLVLLLFVLHLLSPIVSMSIRILDSPWVTIWQIDMHCICHDQFGFTPY